MKESDSKERSYSFQLFISIVGAIFLILVVFQFILFSPSEKSNPISPIFDPFDELDLESSRERQEAVRNAFIHAWKGYKEHAYGMDELEPVSGNSNNIWGGLAVTLVDSLDTLYLMGLDDEFTMAKEIVKNLDFSSSRVINVFEMNIRVLGGLLSAYDLSGDEVFLNKARELGDRLLFAFSTKSGFPVNLIDIASGEHQSSDSSFRLAEVGTMQLEFHKLSYLTKNTTYALQSQAIINLLEKSPSMLPGLIPIDISSSPYETSLTFSGRITFGGAGDSYYEYLLKQFILTDSGLEQYERMYIKSIESMKRTLVRHPLNRPDLAFVGEIDPDGKFQPVMEHLTCFVPGLLALGAVKLKRPDDLNLATRIMKSCYLMYRFTPTGLSPDSIRWSPHTIWKAYPSTDSRTDSGFQVNESSYFLRPETVESLFILYRVTGDSTYRDWGWDIFQAIEKYCKTKIAYSEVQDVRNNNTDNFTDKMQSFFLAETMKYLYLLFSSSSVVALNEWVLNTEAHPFKVIRDRKYLDDLKALFAESNELT